MQSLHNLERIPQQRLSDYDAVLRAPQASHSSREVVDRRLVVYFAIVLLSAAMGIGLEKLNLITGTWASLIVGTAFLLGAIRRLLMLATG